MLLFRGIKNMLVNGYREAFCLQFIILLFKIGFVQHLFVQNEFPGGFFAYVQLTKL